MDNYGANGFVCAKLLWHGLSAGRFQLEKQMDWQRYTKPISPQELSEFRPFLMRLVDVAFEVIIPKFLSEVSVQEKSNRTPVTLADQGAELAMRRLIEQKYPGHGIFGEEYGIKESVLAFPRYRWILDPIDGTRAFISNSFLFGNLVALERDDGDGFGPILSSVSFPAANIRAVGWLGHAELIRELAGKRVQQEIRVRDCSSLQQATLLVTSHWTTPEQVGDQRLQALVDQAKLYRTWGDCFGYFAVASGGADIMIDPDLSYWDVAALVPVVEGAGGVITSLTGGNPLTEKSALCTAGKLQEEIIRLLNR